MWQIDGEKVACGTKVGLVSKWKQSKKLVVKKKGKKSQEVIVNRWMHTSPNDRTFGGTSNECN